MTKLTKIAGLASVVVMVCLLGAAVSKNNVKETGAATVGVEVGTTIVLLDNGAISAFKPGTFFRVLEIKGWHVVVLQSGTRQLKGGNKFVLNLEDQAFQIYRGPQPAKKK